MLIEIDGSAIDDALPGSVKSRECLENFLHAHYAGRHVVCLDLAQCARLKSIAGVFSLRARDAIEAIGFQQSEIRGLRNRVRWRMKVGLGPTFTGAALTRAGKEVIHVHLHHFHEDERSARSVMLGENLTDAALYVAMGKAFAADNNWPAQISFEERGGGGSTTAPTFARLVADERIVLAITDSDKRHPEGPLGGTADKLSRIAHDAFQHVHILQVRSAENLISSAVYREALARKQHKLPALGRMLQAEATPSKQAWRDHAELKGGLKLFELRAMPAGPEATFWFGAAVDLKRDHCQQALPCAKVEDCRCYVTDALGGDALELVVEWLKPRDPKRNAKLLGLATGTPLGDLCEKVLAWGLALRR
jgi:hypothetical protein